MTVLVLTGEFDITADRIVALLTERGVPVFRADTGWFPQRLAMIAEFTGSSWIGELRTDHHRVRLEDIRSVWYRRPTHFSISPALSEEERRFATSEARLGVGGVLASLPVLWVNSPTREADCAYKPAQLAVAGKVGFKVPRTLITNNGSAVHAFSQKVGPRVAHKLLGGAAFVRGGKPLVAYTSMLDAEDLSDLRGVETTAHMFQRWVGDKSYEARVTVVGRQMFAVAIRAGSGRALVDWRSDYDSLSYEVVQAPQSISDSIHAFLKEFGLNFGAFDFVVTPNDEWWFLECNAAGQFGWLEHHTGLPISAALADLLSGQAVA